MRADSVAVNRRIGSPLAGIVPVGLKVRMQMPGYLGWYVPFPWQRREDSVLVWVGFDASVQN